MSKYHVPVTKLQINVLCTQNELTQKLLIIEKFISFCTLIFCVRWIQKTQEISVSTVHPSYFGIYRILLLSFLVFRCSRLALCKKVKLSLKQSITKIQFVPFSTMTFQRLTLTSLNTQKVHYTQNMIKHALLS